MEKFRNTLKNRLALAGVYNAIVLLFMGSGHIMGRRYVLPDFIIGFNTGLFIGVQIVMLWYMGKYSAVLKNAEKLKALYIAENDERSKFIKLQIGGTGINIILGGLALGTIISGFINEIVFFTMLLAFSFSVLVKAVLKIYYNKKV